MFEVKKRGACTRTGRLSGEGWDIDTPNVIYPVSERLRQQPFAKLSLKDRSVLVLGEDKTSEAFSVPDYSGIPVGSDCEAAPMLTARNVCVFRSGVSPEDIEQVRGEVDLFVLDNAIELFQNPRDFVGCITRIRDIIGFQKALYLPGIAVPNNLALLCYMGADLLDSVRTAVLTREGYFLTCDGAWHTSELRGESCSCAACVDGDSDYDRFYRHNMLALHSELQRVRARIGRGDLREFVEYRAKTSPKLVEMLRFMDHGHIEYQELRFPVTGRIFNATTRLSMDRPDVARFRSRVLERYRKPATPSILLLLPCSAKKPYSESKSHGLFRKAIKDSGARILVHELIVTSPLGLVPRELELFYPAQHYDIPVTGHWYEEERKLVNDMLMEFVGNNEYEVVLDHLGEEGFIHDIKVVETAADRPASDGSLDALRDKLEVFKSAKEGKDWKTRTMEELASLARFQFGAKAESWLDGCTVKGRYPQLCIFKGKEQFASLSSSTGQLIPALCGAEELAQLDTYCVHIHDFRLEANLFAVGVKDADPEIRTGDEVVIVRDGELVGAGTAQMPASEMLESDRGEAVRVRHRVK